MCILRTVILLNAGKKIWAWSCPACGTISPSRSFLCKLDF